MLSIIHVISGTNRASDTFKRLQLSADQVLSLIQFLVTIYEKVSCLNPSCNIYFCLADLLSLAARHAEALKYYINGLALITSHYSKLDQLSAILAKDELGTRILSNASICGGEYLHAKFIFGIAHAFGTFLRQWTPLIEEQSTRSELEAWLTSSNSLPLIDTLPGFTGTISCLHDVSLLEHAFKIVQDPIRTQILKVLVSHTQQSQLEKGRKEFCEQDQERRSNFISEISRRYFRKFTIMHGS